MPDLPDTLTIQFDGALDINPGGVGTYGFLIEDEDGNILHQVKGLARRGQGTTNNVAEWIALGFALRFLADAGWKGRLRITGDSKLVINQLTGEWQCKAEHLKKLRSRCYDLLAKICPGGLIGSADEPLLDNVLEDFSWSAEWVNRERNVSADILSKEAYTEITGKKFPEYYRK